MKKGNVKTNKIRFTKLVIFILSFVSIIVLYYYPFKTDKQCGESSLCWVKFGVYTYDYNSEDSRTYFEKTFNLEKK